MNTFAAQTKTSPFQTDAESTVLLVEDEPVVRDVTRAVLEHAGYRVIDCNGPEEALRLAGELRGRIGLLLSDVVMPSMNGPELASRLQSLQPGLITIFMSGYADHVVLRKAMKSGTASFIQKPFTISVLLSRVAAALRKGAEVSEAALLPTH
jgi:two-component system, cell cycle sensor histidine kinase and response regulator CckA